MKYETPKLVASTPAINAIQANHDKSIQKYFEGVNLPEEMTQGAYQDYE
jgi:hypothetical protein